MSKKVIIIGGDGNGGVAASCISDMQNKYNIQDYEVYGFLNDYLKRNDKITEYLNNKILKL